MTSAVPPDPTSPNALTQVQQALALGAANKSLSRLSTELGWQRNYIRRLFSHSTNLSLDALDRLQTHEALRHRPLPSLAAPRRLSYLHLELPSREADLSEADRALSGAIHEQVISPDEVRFPLRTVLHEVSPEYDPKFRFHLGEKLYVGQRGRVEVRVVIPGTADEQQPWSTFVLVGPEVEPRKDEFHFVWLPAHLPHRLAAHPEDSRGRVLSVYHAPSFWEDVAACRPSEPPQKDEYDPRRHTGALARLGLGLKFRDLRRRLGLSIESISSDPANDLTRHKITSIESSEGSPLLKDLEQFAKSLETSLDLLLPWEEQVVQPGRLSPQDSNSRVMRLEHPRSKQRHEFDLLHDAEFHAHLQPFVIKHLGPGSDDESGSMVLACHPGYEFGLVRSGIVESVVIDHETFTPSMLEKWLLADGECRAVPESDRLVATSFYEEDIVRVVRSHRPQLRQDEFMKREFHREGACFALDSRLFHGARAVTEYEVLSVQFRRDPDTLLSRPIPVEAQSANPE